MSATLEMAHSACPSKTDIHAPTFVLKPSETITLRAGRMFTYECEACRTVVLVIERKADA